MPTTYPAKILLFGEHTVLRGSRGLAVPYPNFSLHWAHGTPDTELLSFGEFLFTCGPALPMLRVDELLRDLRAGARLEGNIPLGYGLGSSGAVCAAILDRYGTAAVNTMATAALQQLLARMEGFFHGQSSGTDPLVCYLQQPLLLGGGAAGGIILPKRWQSGWFLLDTGISRSAAPLIERVARAYEEQPALFEREWRQPTERAIAAVVNGNEEQLREAFAAVSAFQLRYTPFLIPEVYRGWWNGAGAYYLKVCGAGGGGMLLGLANDVAETRRVLGARALWLHAAGHQ